MSNPFLVNLINFYTNELIGDFTNISHETTDVYASYIFLYLEINKKIKAVDFSSVVNHINVLQEKDNFKIGKSMVIWEHSESLPANPSDTGYHIKFMQFIIEIFNKHLTTENMNGFIPYYSGDLFSSGKLTLSWDVYKKINNNDTTIV